MFSIADAPDVSAVLSFCWGVATILVPVFETLILGASLEEGDSLSASNISKLDLSETNVTTWLPTVSMATTIANFPLIPTDVVKNSRSFGNQMVMTMLCSFLAVASVTQYVMYFSVVRKSTDEKEKESDKKLAIPHS